MPDGGLKAVPADVGRASIAGLIDGIQPDLLLALGADGAYGHPDHLAVHAWVRACWVALGATRPALLYRVFPPGLFLPQYELCIGMMGDPPHPAAAEIGGEGAHYTVDTSSVGVARRASIAAHRTQLPGGQPDALFPADIVSRLLAGPERFDDATGVTRPEVERLLGALHSA
jgi:LmbE family N-acetylglucosaminyl deacetylase